MHGLLRLDHLRCAALCFAWHCMSPQFITLADAGLACSLKAQVNSCLAPSADSSSNSVASRFYSGHLPISLPMPLFSYLSFLLRSYSRLCCLSVRLLIFMFPFLISCVCFRISRLALNPPLLPWCGYHLISLIHLTVLVCLSVVQVWCFAASILLAGPVLSSFPVLPLPFVNSLV